MKGKDGLNMSMDMNGRLKANPSRVFNSIRMQEEIEAAKVLGKILKKKEIDFPFVKKQALIIKRNVRRMKKIVEGRGDGELMDICDHLLTNIDIWLNELEKGDENV